MRSRTENAANSRNGQNDRKWENMNCHIFAIHYLQYSTTCDIVISDIWPKPNARKWRLQARWGGFPLLWLGGHIPLAAKAAGGQIWATAGMFLGFPSPLPGAVCRGRAGGTACTALNGLAPLRAGQVSAIDTKALVFRLSQCSYENFGGWLEAA